MQNSLLEFFVLFELLLILDVFAVTTPIRLGAIVPTIDQDGYQLMGIINKYRLSLRGPSDDDEREEVVELRNPGTPEEELVVKGTLRSVYPDTGALVTLTYIADRNGYRIQYKYDGLGPTLPGLDFQFISPTGLKSATG